MNCHFTDQSKNAQIHNQATQNSLRVTNSIYIVLDSQDFVRFKFHIKEMFKQVRFRHSNVINWVTTKCVNKQGSFNQSNFMTEYITEIIIEFFRKTKYYNRIRAYSSWFLTQEMVTPHSYPKPIAISHDGTLVQKFNRDKQIYQSGQVWSS